MLYDRIPHIPGSSTRKTDLTVEAKVHHRLFENPLPGDLIIVQEKLDGVCVGVRKVSNDWTLCLDRDERPIDSEASKELRIFTKWVQRRNQKFLKLLQIQETAIGEWLALRHGTAYNLRHAPFVLLEIEKGGSFISYEELKERAKEAELPLPQEIMVKQQPVTLNQGLASQRKYNWHRASNREGLVWKLENNGVRNPKFTCQFRCSSHPRDLYLPQHNYAKESWNWVIQ